MDLCLQGNSDNVKNALEIIKNFEKQSGFKTSYEKTTLYRIGSLRKTDAKWYTKLGLRWDISSINSV